MSHSVSHCRFGNNSVFWIPDVKGVIMTVFVGVSRQVILQNKQIIFQITLKCHYVRPFTLASSKLIPRGKNTREIN